MAIPTRALLISKTQLSALLLAVLVVVSVGAASAQIGIPEPVQPSQAPRAEAVPPSAPLAPTSRPAPLSPDVARGFEAYKTHLEQRARNEGVRDATVEAYVPTLQISQRVIDLDRSQAPSATPTTGPEPLTPYLEKHVTGALVSSGQSRYYSDWPQLVRIYQRYGVDPAILMAIYGQETHYGVVTGKFDLLEALASLAYEGRRRAMFEDEFLSALKLIDSGVPREQLKGSYAGATGLPQFMPSLALRSRVDGDGDGNADIWSNEVDALASIANVFHERGWKPGVAWGTAIRVPAMIHREALQTRTEAPRCPAVFRRLSRWMTVAEWRRLGVTVVGQALRDDEMATLLEPNGPDGSGYLLTANYRVILDYNCSNSYAMSVGLLSDAIARRGSATVYAGAAAF